jgi:CubicO group peptidase (beta-lactamase class C family)
VRDAFSTNFAEHGEVGAACCVYHDGRPVVDIWGGVADPATGRPWADDTVVLTYSCTKGVTAVCANLLIDRGELDPDAPVARYWPEFDAAGKSEIPVRWLLSHQAGLAVVEGDFTLDDVLAWDPIVTALAAQAPSWEPGSAHGYHLRSFGWLVGELIRRVSGRRVGRFLAEEVAGPLGLDFWIGLPEAEEARVAPVVPAAAMVDPSVLWEVLPAEAVSAITGPSNLFHYDERWNQRPLHAAEMPSSNGIGEARALARLYAATIGAVDGVRLLRPDTVDAARTPQARGRDRILQVETGYGLGFMVRPSLALGTPETAFGHPGAGGSLAFADPAAGIALGYVMNRLRFDLDDPRARSLTAAAYESLA